jgi:hypothetical protein
MKYTVAAVTLSFLLFSAPAFAQQCLMTIKACPDGSFVTPMGTNCQYPPCGGYPLPADPYAPPPGSTGHYTPPPGIFKKQAEQAQQPTGAACTKDAFICPDGTTVGRVPPMCNFARCPVVENPQENPVETPEEPPVEGEEPPAEEDAPQE